MFHLPTVIVGYFTTVNSWEYREFGRIDMSVPCRAVPLKRYLNRRLYLFILQFDNTYDSDHTGTRWAGQRSYPFFESVASKTVTAWPKVRNVSRRRASRENVRLHVTFSVSVSWWRVPFISSRTRRKLRISNTIIKRGCRARARDRTLTLSLVTALWTLVWSHETTVHNSRRTRVRVHVIYLYRGILKRESYTFSRNGPEIKDTEHTRYKPYVRYSFRFMCVELYRQTFGINRMTQ